MGKIFVSLLLTLVCFYSLKAQDFTVIDSKVDNYPRSFTKPEKLAELINRDFKTDLERARAIYRWIASNIKYDVDAYYAGSKPISFSYTTLEEKKQKELEIARKQNEQTLKKKKAVCEGYSGLYKYLCDLTGLECVVIQGYSKTMDRDIGRVPKNSDHAWNAVKINNKWELVDVTWGAGSVDYSKKAFIQKFNDVYFMTPPELFFLKHYPENKDWLFVKKSLQDFVDLPLYYSDFAVSGISIIKPEKGIIKAKAGDKIEFRWKTSLDPKELTWAFKGDKYARELSSTSKDGILSFEIKLEKSVPEFVTFYYKGSAIVSYKLEKK
jgi:transglutaminase/protease-like cytokinesis protein 3